MNAETQPVCDEAKRFRRILWLWFWALFLGSPCLAILFAKLEVSDMAIAVFIPLVLGPVAAGFVLSKLLTRTWPWFIVLGILFSIVILAIYWGAIGMLFMSSMGHNC